MNITNIDRWHIKMVIEKFQRYKSQSDVFYDLCFCICAPQTTFTSNQKVIKELMERNFFEEEIPLEEMRKIVKPVRFLRKAEYLLAAKQNFSTIYCKSKEKISSYEKREWLVKNVKGIGMKAASHFLRNLGHTDLAIIDTHILKFMHKPLPTSKKDYLSFEQEFNEIARQHSLTPVGLDAYIWKVQSKTHWSDFIF